MANANNICNIDGCDLPIFVKKTPHGALCNAHYKRYRLGQDMKAPLRIYRKESVEEGENLCAEEGCDRRAIGKHGRCQSHRVRDKDGVDSNIRRYSFQSGECEATGCTNPAKSRGFCGSHFRHILGSCVKAGCARRVYNKKTMFCFKHHKQHTIIEKRKANAKETN